MTASVDVSGQGYPIRFQWGAVADATTAEVTGAAVTIRSVVGTESLGPLAVSPLSGQPVVTVPAGRRIRSLTLAGLKAPDGKGLRFEGDLAGRRLVVSVLQSGSWTPLFAVPAVGPRGLLPAALVGASFANGVLTLPDLAAPKLRLSLVTGDFPEQFAAQTLTLTSVTGVAAAPTKAVELVDPSGATVWSFPGELPAAAPPTVVDLRAPAEAALRKALGAPAPPDVTFRLRSAAGGTAGIDVTTAHGALVRSFEPPVLRTELAGEPLALPLGALPAEAPTSATADVTIAYRGLRLLESIADAVPVAGGTGGAVVRTEPVLRELPPEALHALAPARVGVIGRAPVACELSVALVDAHSREPVGPPGVLQLEPSDALATQWVELAGQAPQDRALAVSVRATTGRFLWAAAGGQQLLKLAVHDPDPGGRPLLLGGAQLASVTAETSHTAAQQLAPAAFAGRAPLLESSLFLTVDVSDLTLRYAR